MCRKKGRSVQCKYIQNELQNVFLHTFIMIVWKTKVTQGNMGSKWIFFIFTYFIFSINQKYTQIYAEEENSSDLEEEKSRELYMDQVSRLRKCSGKRTPEKVTCQQCIHILMNYLLSISVWKSFFFFRFKLTM